MYVGFWFFFLTCGVQNEDFDGCSNFTLSVSQFWTEDNSQSLPCVN